MRADFMVYVWFRPWDASPCYVGKGRGNRYRKLSRTHNAHLAAIIKKAGGSLPIVVIRCGLTESEAFETEIALIKAIGRKANGGPLANLTDGGEGTSGAVMSPEWRAHRGVKAREAWADPVYRATLTKARLGNHHSAGHSPSAEVRAVVAEKMRGNTHTLGLRHKESSKILMSKARKGVPKTESHRAAIGAGHRGKKKSESHRAAMSACRIGVAMDEDTKLKISESTTGVPKSAEARENMRAGWVRRHAFAAALNADFPI